MKKLFFLVLSVVLLSGCAALDSVQEDLGKVLDEQKESVKEMYDNKKAELQKSIDDKVEEMKQDALRKAGDIAYDQIDSWLKKQGLNEYGDKVETNYTGGTPLFNESTGESKDRYQYILERHPELLEVISGTGSGIE